MGFIHNKIYDFLAQREVTPVEVFETEFAENLEGYTKIAVMKALGHLIENGLVFNKNVVKWTDKDGVEWTRGIENEGLKNFLALHNISEPEISPGYGLFNESVKPQEEIFMNIEKPKQEAVFEEISDTEEPDTQEGASGAESSDTSDTEVVDNAGESSDAESSETSDTQSLETAGPNNESETSETTPQGGQSEQTETSDTTPQSEQAETANESEQPESVENNPQSGQ